MKTNPRPRAFLVVGAALCLLAVGLLAGEWHRAQRAAHAARELWAQRFGELDRLTREDRVGPRTFSAALAQAETEFAERRQALMAPDKSAALPVTPLDAWFEASAAQDRLKAMAEHAGVALAPDERFGLVAHGNRMPDAADLATSSRQRAVTEVLLGILFSARPRAFLSVRGELPDEAGADEQENSSQLEPRLSVRVPALIETTAFRLEFTGQTAVLRDFLNGMANSAEPLVVRSVEAAPVAEEFSRAAAAGPGLLPVVVPGLTKFSVTIEHVVLTAPAP